MALAILPKGNTTASRSGAIHYQQHITDWTVTDVEICFRIPENDWSVLPKLIKAAVEYVSDVIKKKNINPVNIALEFRISRGTKSAVMSPAYEDDPNQNDYFLWIEILGTQTFPNWWEYGIEFAKALNKISVGKVHWCKWFERENGQNYWKNNLKEVYNNQISEFEKWRKIQDPQGIFLTSFWEKMLA